jgi:hypothetical protein
MKNTTFSISLLLSGLLLFVASDSSAQSYSIDWFKISGGGDTGAGGNYQISGTIGQSEAGATLSGGRFAMTGGFWSPISVVQTPGAPQLSITYAATQAIVSWPLAAIGWILQTNDNLATPTWGNYLGPVNNNSATNSLPSATLFFRLHR